ncbi:MAG: Txe/YoeB family addiction module toxin [Clostridia bacterium]|nr:Txe/YoeB family addiction module toxin [Clostridia bacterium]
MGGGKLISFEDSAFAEYRQWAKEDRKIIDKIDALITEIRRDPFRGTGKPEPLKGNRSGQWSRRITQEHRLVYQVLVDQIVIISCRYHY